MKRPLLLMLVAASFFLVSQARPPGAGAAPVSNLKAGDTPGDGGESVTLEWEGGPNSFVTIMRSETMGGPFEEVGSTYGTDRSYQDYVNAGVAYYYQMYYQEGDEAYLTAVVGPAVARSNWFRGYRVNALILSLLMFGLVILYINAAKRGKRLYIRRIAGISAIDEAVGRATEMGKKIMYIPGIMSISDIQTIASLSILSHVAKQTAIYGADIEVPNKDPLTFTAARETVKQAYMEAGRPDQFREDMVTYITYDQFAYAAAVTGKMVREKPATNFLIGYFFAESLILAETGQSTGAIQIAGTAAPTQLPFFVTTCDYTLMGEELYAASAYLSREPILLGSIKAQDIAKAIIIVAIAVGIVELGLGSSVIKEFLIAR
jgi:hypothetical protein